MIFADKLILLRKSRLVTRGVSRTNECNTTICSKMGGSTICSDLDKMIRLSNYSE